MNKLPEWMMPISEGYKSGKITKDEYEKCIAAIPSVRKLKSYADYKDCSWSFQWCEHEYGEDFWQTIHTKTNQ